MLDAAPPGWYVGRPAYNERFREWEQHAFDPTERARDGTRSREWTAVAPTELEVVRELARCLRLNRVGAGAGAEDSGAHSNLRARLASVWPAPAGRAPAG